jgi:UDP-N-acetyl-D-mannosaminuronic acid dehydrogenase
MSLESIQNKIQQKSAKIAVIGLGYVGLPVAALFAEAGFDVLGVELKSSRVDQINAGISPIEGEEPGLAELMTQVAATGRLKATDQYALLGDRDIILIDVETPVDEQHIPQYAALRAVLTHLGPVLRPGALVIVESTIAPGTMQALVLPMLEHSSGRRLNEGFFLGNCPERVMPGKLLHNLRTLSRVVGGGSPETAQVMTDLYRNIVQGDLDPADWITAELVKTVENAYRDVQIAFANEVACICEQLGGDVWKVRELVNKTPARSMHRPGAGVGGHCIPKDPWLLAYGVRGSDVPLRLIPAARETNDSMPAHVAGMIQRLMADCGSQVAGARILILGYAYLENSDDTRNSPSEALARQLRGMGAETVIHDPHVAEFQGDLLEMASGCDAAVVMVAHRVYGALDLKALRAALRNPLLVDGRHVFSADQARAAGLTYREVGAGV